jgi:hypothetical protein
MKFCIFKPIALILISIWLTAGADENTKKKTDIDFHVVVGAQSRSDIKPCADYASKYSYTGKPYYVFVPETRKTITRHEGMDFCAKSGADVLAAATGKVIVIDQDNPYRGGRVTIETNLLYDQYGNDQIKSFLYVDALHINPRAGLKIGDLVNAGDVIGTVQSAGKIEIGPTSHVHLSAGPWFQTWITHTDPNRFWQKGAGIVTCFDSTNPPTDQQLVAPIRCK